MEIKVIVVMCMLNPTVFDKDKNECTTMNAVGRNVANVEKECLKVETEMKVTARQMGYYISSYRCFPK